MGGGKDGEDDTDSDEVIVRRMPTRRGRKSMIDPNETPKQRAEREVRVISGPVVKLTTGLERGRSTCC